MNRLVDTFCDMVRISSESGQETQFIAYLKDVFSSRFDATCSTDGYGNLMAKIPAKDSTVEEPVLFGVQGDTVKPGQDIESVVEDGIIRSKGETILGADDKAGIAELAEAIEIAGRRPPLEIVVTREEGWACRGRETWICRCSMPRLALSSTWTIWTPLLSAARPRCRST